MKIREKTHRLPNGYYRGNVVASITACVQDRSQFFTTIERFQVCEEILLASLEQYGCMSDVYLFMPDHAHMLLRGENESSDLLSAMKLFKQKTGYWLAKAYRDVQWQKSFYDHILREEKEIFKHVWYVLDNPVRKGIVRKWKEYPYKGSTVYDFREWDDDPEAR